MERHDSYTLKRVFGWLNISYTRDPILQKRLLAWKKTTPLNNIKNILLLYLIYFIDRGSYLTAELNDSKNHETAAANQKLSNVKQGQPQ